jgi:GxxExxY protein
MTENELSYVIRGAVFKVYNTLGPGLLESVYEYALAFELKELGYNISCQRPFPVVYRGNVLENGFRLDIIVENMVIIEIKSVEQLTDVHHKQLLTYLKLTGVKLGLLINFNTNNLSGSIVRIVNNL